MPKRDDHPASPDATPEGPPDAGLLALDSQLCFAVYAAAHAFVRAYRPLLERLGLTYPQYLVMLVLWEGDGLTVRAIGERLGLDSGTLTPLLKRLAAAGLVVRSRDSEDERQVRVTLTAEGRALRGGAAELPRVIAGRLQLSGPELGRLRQEIDGLRLALDAALDDAEAKPGRRRSTAAG